MTHFAAAYPQRLNSMLGHILADQIRTRGNVYEELQHSD
jgi:hypothetical protein